MKLSLFATAAVLCLTGTAAFAQATHDGRWYIAPTVGVVINDNQRQKDTGGAVGLAVGKALNEKWNVEFGSQYIKHNSNDKQASLGVDGLYFFNRNPDFAPYAVVGLGWVREGSNFGGHNDNALLKAGLGFTKQLTDNIDFRTDARYQVHGNKGNSGGSGNLGDWVISAGLNIALGPKAQAPAPAYVAPAYVAPAPEPIAVTPPPVVAPVEPAPAPYVAPQRATKQDRN
ncbi:outer membrane beta-barrel protein [Polaromonas naphthalenivorans]|uniref:Outer membrane protein n=1 Tax=Polaromonas naphthalenivorans (strain CJ2) TaxID=365044 RepID=A1VL44_POLNA|nr:outer membrane beta-barrel protein [Polaromonas naphthalenivorans]ABM36372.1 outer membrane protein [Polaromonas naphthalenivorans CJ2]